MAQRIEEGAAWSMLIARCGISFELLGSTRLQTEVGKDLLNICG